MDYAHPARPGERLGNDDRSAAVAALATHQTDGRISASEYSERAAAVSTAQTWADLATVFADLPVLPDGGGSTARPGVAPAGSGPAGSGPAGFGGPPPGRPVGYGGYAPDGRRGRRALGGRVGVAIVSVAPLIAVLLFFLTGITWGFNWSWLWFLLVPIAGAIVYAPSWYEDRDDR